MRLKAGAVRRPDVGVAEGYPEVVKVLIVGGADVHARSKVGFTAFLFAARQGRSRRGAARRRCQAR
jgi:hypothetical protein